LLAVAAGAGARAQGTRATVAGTVKDSRGIALPRITVTIRNLESEAERQAVTGPDGTFSVGGLAPGRYNVSIEDTGIVPFQQEVTVEAGGRAALEIALSYTVPDFIPVPDRWRLTFPNWIRYQNQDGEFPFVPNRGFDPYDQNILKGDLPIAGDDIFMVLTAISETPFEYRALPPPSSPSASAPPSDPFDGNGEQFAFLPSAIFSFELFKGNTAFKPRDWSVRVTPQFNHNYLRLAPPGTTRSEQHLALQEAFAEVKIAEVGPNFDFMSVRGGIQPFNSDFRGFLFRDSNLGVRAFGNWGQNRNQWNAAYFDQLEKNSISELNTLQRREHGVFIANYYRQDFLTEGYTVSPSFHASLDNGVPGPASPAGSQPHQLRAYYAGFGGDGHWGRWNVTHQFYQVVGRDQFNGIAAQPVEINAQFAALEFSIDQDWYRPRVGVVFASGDDDPDDDRARGFDAIMDNPNIAGGAFSFWVRQGLQLPVAGIGLNGRHSVLPDLRSGENARANFVNPGVLVINGGIDAQLTTKLKLVTNINLLRFRHTETLQRVLSRSEIDNAIGVDVGGGFQYRPALNENLVITGGLSALVPAAGFKQIFSDKVLYAPFLVVTLTY
jgi:hypothetical protein